jgi:hypothetical protein
MQIFRALQLRHRGVQLRSVAGAQFGTIVCAVKTVCAYIKFGCGSCHTRAFVVSSPCHEVTGHNGYTRLWTSTLSSYASSLR